MYPRSIKSLPIEIQARAALERRIVRSLVNEFAAHDFTFIIDDGMERIQCASIRTALKALINTDEDQLGIVDKAGDVIGWIKLTYGNDGWDVMSDWHTNLDEYMPKTLALVEKLQ